ncbi:cytochrome P450 [Kutzneria viridogrisea]|uniref:Cytochrome P450 n=1 Tax=Kutzneria viridogrisea TaxID=47990 RepID=A0ABR6BCW6_9PSEU|nr:cytochrome P450 [Kutzneria viridogrisea]
MSTPRGLTQPRPAGPVVCVDGPVWIVTEPSLARQVLIDPRIVKDPAYAPPHWDPREVGLEPTAAEHLSLTTVDGPEHVLLRRAHAPLFSARRVRAHADRITEIARELLTGLGTGTVDLVTDFTSRYPLTVLLELLGVPLDRLDQATAASQLLVGGDPGQRGAAIASYLELAAAAGGAGLAAELRERLPERITDPQLHYLLFGLIFAGQVTTEAALGYLLAHALHGRIGEEDLVGQTLRQHPPAPFTLWRFTSTEVELAGVPLPARAAVLIDIAGLNAEGHDLTFGGGPHYCVGAQLALAELGAVLHVLRTEFPRARLAVPFEDLREVHLGGIQGSRLTALPVTLTG